MRENNLETDKIRSAHGNFGWNAFQMHFAKLQLLACRVLKGRLAETKKIEMSASLASKFSFFLLIECKKRLKFPWRRCQYLLSETWLMRLLKFFISKLQQWWSKCDILSTNNTQQLESFAMNALDSWKVKIFNWI